jgi:S-adenosyl-L-methionine hydrolase (adenosine-forming)
MSNIVTLITDFRTSDGYMGAIFGVIKSINPELDLITIASNIPPADIRKASRALANSYLFYPENSIHMIVVDPTVGPLRRALIVDDGRYLFLGPDNGVLTPVLKNCPDCKCYDVQNKKYQLVSGSETFHGRDLFAPVAAYLSLGIPPDEFGPPVTDPVIIEDPVPEKVGRDILGKVIDIDAFGNLVTNIPAEMIPDNPIITVCGRKIAGVSKSYADVVEKQPLAYIGSSGTLEIAINRGNAANYFGAFIFEDLKITDGGKR